MKKVKNTLLSCGNFWDQKLENVQHSDNILKVELLTCITL